MAEESKLERKFIRAVKRAGGITVKNTPMGRNGWPDRSAIFKPGRIAYVELKAAGRRPDPLQDAVIDELRNMGVTVWVIDCEELIIGFIKAMTT